MRFQTGNQREVCYHPIMPTTLDKMIAKVRSWPKERQEDVARMLQSIEDAGTTVYTLSSTENAEIDAALSEVANDDLASEAEVVAFKTRHDL